MTWQVLEIKPTALAVDTSPMALDDSTVNRAINMDFFAGTARSLPDFLKLTTPPHTPYALQYYSDSINQHIATCGNDGVWAWGSTGVWDNIKPASGLTGSTYWDTTAFGKWLIVTNDKVGELPHAISATSPTSTVNLAPLPGWPATWECTLIRTHRNVLWAANTIEAGVAYPNRVRWSTSAPTDALPSSWTPAANNDAGQNDLEFTHGQVVDMAACGDVMFISGAGGLYAARWIGGQYVYNFSKVLDQGARALRCMEAIDGNTVVMLTSNDLILATESNTKSIAIGRVRDIISTMDKAEVLYIAPLRQVYINYSKAGETGYQHVLIWDIDTDTFGYRDITATPLTCAGWGVNPVTATEATWSNTNTAWDETFIKWGLPPSMQIRYFGGNAQGLWSGGGQLADWYIARESMPAPEGDQIRVEAIEVEADGRLGSSISVRCGIAEYPSQPPNWSQDKVFTIGEENLRNDVDLTGKYLSWAVAGTEYCRINKIRFYYRAVGIKP